ncbi:MAG: hypothetical protein JO269_03385 [Burkholderiaceae bacterium]|nr:hypothetical protein [Burkholderiaceae bacterium]
MKVATCRTCCSAGYKKGRQLIQFDETKYKVWKLPNFLLAHWILNPGLAFNELILGQRIPKVTLVDTTSSAPLTERQFIPCPTCGEIHDSRLWSKGNAFGHWFGLLCPKCESKIPCLWNLTSLLVLGLTFPVWLPMKLLFEEKWKRRELRKLRTMRDAPPFTARKISWLGMSIGFGFLMFCFRTLPKLFTGSLNVQQAETQAIIWGLAGLVFGTAMWLFFNQKK